MSPSRTFITRDDAGAEALDSISDSGSDDNLGIPWLSLSESVFEMASVSPQLLESIVGISPSAMANRAAT